MSKYAVVRKVMERTGPSITTFAGKAIASGQVVDISDVIKVKNETWGRIANRERTYVSICIGDVDYLALLEPLPNIDIIEKLILWARIQGFKP